MKAFKKILVVVDTNAEEHPELAKAIKIADQASARLHLVDVIRHAGLTSRLLTGDFKHVHQLLIDEKKAGVEKLVQHCRAHGIEAEGEVVEGQSSQQVAETARRINADLIIRASKGAGSREAGTLGRTSLQLLRLMSCPVWLTQPQHEPDYQKVIAAVDASPDDQQHEELNRRILSCASEIARFERCKLMVCYVWNLYGSEMLKHRMPANEFEALTDYNRKQNMASFETLLKDFDMHATGPEAKMLEGDPSAEIPKLCSEEEADLLICGSVARSGLSGLMLGNTAERIVNRVQCSLLVLAPEAAPLEGNP